MSFAEKSLNMSRVYPVCCSNFYSFTYFPFRSTFLIEGSPISFLPDSPHYCTRFAFYIILPLFLGCRRKLGLNRLATSCGETHLQPKREQQNSQIPSAKEQESNKRDRDSPLARQRKQIYGLIWISATLVFLLASLGNCATYLIHKQTNHSTSWSFDVSYVSVAACTVYGYVLVVPTAFYFLLQYLGISASLVRFWCMWGYSLFIFIPTSFLLIIPVELIRWIIIILVSVASACFVTLNLKSYIQGNDLMLMLVSSFVLQVALALFIKIWFFP